MKGDNEQSFNFNEFDDKSKGALIEVVKEIREQWIIDGCYSQFWFYASQSSNTEITESIALKWLRVLKGKNIIYYYKPSFDLDILSSIAIARQQIDPNHKWDERIGASLLLNPPADSRPGVAIDTLGVDFDQLLDAISATNVWGKFRLDSIGRYFYGNIELTTINNSIRLKTLLGELLAAKDHTITRDMFETVFAGDMDGKKRRQIVYELGLGLSEASHNIVIESGKSGRKVTYYKLTFK